MSLKILPNDVQSLLFASAQVNTYKRAVEELIYNSLDAESTSIAIRIHIQESTIQVIDNGCGVTKHDFNVIGQRHMTSKLTDVTTLKAAPKNYGYRGEFLANIIAVSQTVKITSRHQNTEETWAKTFYNGKEKKFAQMTTRPTKGTTIDIKGFLYNLNIQKRGIDPINELHNVKLYLEQLSLVHNNISLSLRDDSKNEIVFKIHKKRDIYQTLSTLFDIDKGGILELHVEKHEYKVKGLIGKANMDLDLHWIYLNGKFIHRGSKLHKTIDENFKKSLLFKDHRRLKSKKNNEEHQLFDQNIPFYFIFVTCPYFDYDINCTLKQSVIEFKNWEQMNKLLEKLVKFYVGDVNLKEVKKTDNKLINKEQNRKNVKVDEGTRDQVKKIMDKILGNKSNKIGISQLQNGVKGKLVKRKSKKKNTKRSINAPILPQNDKTNKFGVDASPKSKSVSIFVNNVEQYIQDTVDNLNKRKVQKTPDIAKKQNEIKKTSDLNPKRHKDKDISMHKKRKGIKAKILLPTKKMDKIAIKQKHRHKHQKVNENEFKSLTNTDSVHKRSKIVARKAEEFLRHYKVTRKADINYFEDRNMSCKKNTVRNKYCEINYNPLQTNTNNYIIDKYIMNKLKTKSYKTTYDLVQTILKSQQEVINFDKNSMSDFYKKVYKPSHCLPKVSKLYTRANKFISRQYSDIYGKKEIPQNTDNNLSQYNTFEYEDNFSACLSPNEHKEISDTMTYLPERFELMFKDINGLNQIVNYTPKESSYRALSGPSILTYDSHECRENQVFVRTANSKCYTNNKRQNIRFITKQSRENFIISKEFRGKLKKPLKSESNKSKFYDIRQSIHESLYTIEYSNSNESNFNPTLNNIFSATAVGNNSVDFSKVNDGFKKKTYDNYENDLPTNNPHSVFGNTYTIQPSISSFDINIESQNQTNNKFKSSELFETYLIHDSNSKENDVNIESKMARYGFIHNIKNVVFVSKPQCSATETSVDNNINIQPLNVCEAVLHDIGSNEREFAFSFNENNRINNSLYDYCDNIEGGIDECIENDHVKEIQDEHITENLSHHFSCTVKTKEPHLINNKPSPNNHLQDSTPANRNQDKKKIIVTEDLPILNTEGNINAENIDCNFKIKDFNFKNRPRFVPKGMSQIFENCRTKTACDYNLDKDYFEDSIYYNFANDVKVNSEIYEPIIQNVEDLTTKNIHNFQNKVQKDNASLVFDEISLKEAKILGQADCKFIAAIMKNRFNQSQDVAEYLILFDQHAVHERIRLEKNLADYLNEERWTSVTVDNIILKMSKDEILYLHNYKDKFILLGLQWTILNDNEVTVHSIPEAILGKNPREVEKVIKAVKNLIIEEITVIKLQKGCVSLYPKSIMDLVFSEACRYAIKFGDQLSKNDCVELLNALSNCKTPFQCAHGRPVMAVIMDIKADKRQYKINMDKLKRFK